MAALLVPKVASHAAAGQATRPSRRDRCDRAPSGASAVDERRCAPALNMLFAPSPSRTLCVNTPVGVCVENRVLHEMSQKPSLGAKDAVVVSEGDREAAKTAATWEAFMTFHRAPCLRPSLGIGFAGGLGIGALRYLSGSSARAVFTWGSLVGGLLAGTSWFTCRRSMYAAVAEEAALLTRVQAGDAEALQEYQRRLEARAKKGPARPSE